MEVFELLGFTKFFKIAQDLDEALEMLSGEKIEEKHEEKKSEEKNMFPLIFQCPYCGKKLKTSKPGKFKCSGCGGIFVVSENGSVNPV